MEKSFHLLSSMSPKIKKGHKPVIKGTSVLALKKPFRRSLIFDKKKPTTNNESLILIESSGSETISDTQLKIVKPNENIEISESLLVDDASIVNDEPSLPKQKIEDIKNWINNLEIPIVQKDCSIATTAFSEVSTIFGDDIHFQSEGNEIAVNSTFTETNNHKRFDEMFKKKNKEVKRSEEQFNFKKSSQECCSPTIEKCVTNENINTNPRHRRKEIEDSFLNNEEISNEDKENVDFNQECESMLDSLYGKSWRENKEHVLPKTEPKRKLENKVKIRQLQTERKKPEKANNLLQTLHKARLKLNFESPWVDKLKGLCDSDTSTEGSPDVHKVNKKLSFDDDGDDSGTNIDKVEKLRDDQDGVNKKLSFDDDDDDDRKSIDGVSEPVEKKDTGDDSFSDFSDLGESLEDRIRKKDNKINTKNAPKTKKTTSNNNKEDNNRKNTKNTRQKKNVKKFYIESSSEDEEQIDTKKKQSIEKKTYTFLESLSTSVPIDKCDMSARIFRNNFKEYKQQLADKLLTLYNEQIFDNSIPTTTPIEWNDKMRGSAGFCYCRKITKSTGAVQRAVRIALSTKVVDSADRLRDTLVHELCHAATWLVNNVSDGHGPYWKAWASKAMRQFPELPPIKRCHDYVINTKYTYKCTGCGYSIGRHSKSLDIERKRCGYCYEKFEVLINKTTKKGETRSVPATPRREPTAFSKFVKENYSQYKTKALKHGDVMKILGQKFGELKVTTS